MKTGSCDQLRLQWDAFGTFDYNIQLYAFCSDTSRRRRMLSAGMVSAMSASSSEELALSVSVWQATDGYHASLHKSLYVCESVYTSAHSPYPRWVMRSAYI